MQRVRVLGTTVCGGDGVWRRTRVRVVHVQPLRRGYDHLPTRQCPCARVVHEHTQHSRAPRLARYSTILGEQPPRRAASRARASPATTARTGAHGTIAAPGCGMRLAEPQHSAGTSRSRRRGRGLAHCATKQAVWAPHKPTERQTGKPRCARHLQGRTYHARRQASRSRQAQPFRAATLAALRTSNATLGNARLSSAHGKRQRGPRSDGGLCERSAAVTRACAQLCLIYISQHTIRVCRLACGRARVGAVTSRARIARSHTSATACHTPYAWAQLASLPQCSTKRQRLCLGRWCACGHHASGRRQQHSAGRRRSTLRPRPRFHRRRWCMASPPPVPQAARVLTEVRARRSQRPALCPVMTTRAAARHLCTSVPRCWRPYSCPHRL